MKKILIVLLILFVTTGCTQIQQQSIPEITSNILTSKYSLVNHTMSGYKYYLPRGLKSVIVEDYNEIISSKYYDYYLYMDIISYYNNIKKDYISNKTSYYSAAINYKKKQGYVEINQIDEDLYLIELMYNYAKVEVKVKKSDINLAYNNALTIASTVKYNDDVIKELIGSNDLVSTEETINIFETSNGESNFLDTVAEYDNYTDTTQDPDVIK